MNESTLTQTVTHTWLKSHGLKIGALLFWLALLGSYQWYAWQNDLSPVQVMQQLLGFMTGSLWGPLIYIILYAIRPLVLFPSTVLTLAGGFLFGPILGVLYTIVASNTSATIAFFVGRYFGQGLLKEGASESLLQRYAERMRQNSFETVIVMRFIFLPYDLVNYLAGFLRIRWVPFILATILGSIPGTIAFILAGASIERFDGGIPQLNPVTLAASVAIFIVSLVLSRLFKKREGIEK
jgi:uncharacterized membrane protein YdjX (TVP38/TMEM64 family)